MESKSQSASSGDCMSKSKNDNSSLVNQKKGSKTDDLSTPTDPKRHCPYSRDRTSIVITDVSSPIRRRSDHKDDCSSNPTGQGSGSSALPAKRHGEGVVSDERSANTMFFSDVTQGPHQAELRFRLIYFWEARNPHMKLLIGEEMLFIDEKHMIRKKQTNRTRGLNS